MCIVEDDEVARLVEKFSPLLRTRAEPSECILLSLLRHIGLTWPAQCRAELVGLLALVNALVLPRSLLNIIKPEQGEGVVHVRV